MDDILAAPSETQYFSTLDLASGYWKVELTEMLDQRQLSPLSKACLNSLECLSASAMHQLHSRE